MKTTGRGRKVLRGLVAAAASVFGLSCGSGSSTRYMLAVDPGSRSRFQYVRDRVTGQWVYREIELRVDSLRPMPNPISDDEHGDKLSMQLFKPGTAKTGGLRSGTPTLEGGYRIWRGADIVDEADLDGKAAYGVNVEWPREGEETRHDPLEVFPLPPLSDTEPGVWSEWFTASSTREGAFGWWEEVHGKPPDSLPMPERPFELRWRLVLIDVPGRVP